MKAFTLLMIALLTGGAATAQSLKVAPMFGPNFTFPLMSAEARDVYFVDGIFEDDIRGKASFPPKIGLQIGGLVDYGITETFSVQSGLMLNMRGFKHKASATLTEYGITERVSARTNFTINYLEIPLWASYRLGESGFKVQGGFGIGFAVGGKGSIRYTYDGESETISDKISVGNDPDYDHAKPIDINFNLGFSKEIPIGDNPLELTVYVQPSLNKWQPVYPDEEEYNMRHFTFGIRAAYFFKIK